MKIVDCPEDQVVVFLEEEYGYRSWVWYTGKSEAELIEWWKNLETVSPYFFTPVGLPGTLKEQLYPDEGDERLDGGVYTYAENSTNNKKIFLRLPKSFWTGHIHEDGDSYLHHDKHGYVVHRGRCSRDEEGEPC